MGPISGNPVAIKAQRQRDRIDHRQTRTLYTGEPLRTNGRSKPTLTFSTTRSRCSAISNFSPALYESLYSEVAEELGE